MELQYKSLRILSRYFSCQDSEFRSAMETSSVDIDNLRSKNFFLWKQCPKVSLLLFKDGADLRVESFSCKQSPLTLLFVTEVYDTPRYTIKNITLFCLFGKWGGKCIPIARNWRVSEMTNDHYSFSSLATNDVLPFGKMNLKNSPTFKYMDTVKKKLKIE